MNIFTRIGLWLGSLLLAVTLFSLLSGLLFSSIFSLRGALLIFRVTLIFAFPVWCLCLPFVVAFKDAEAGRIRPILLSGTLIGPAAVGLWCLILQLKGARAIWQGDPLIGVGGSLGMIFALIVGFLATSFYVIALKIFR